MRRPDRTFLAWAGTRALLLVMVLLPKVGGSILFGDARLYARWARGILTWDRVPYRDFAWEYPPATTLAILPPGLAPYWYKTLLVAEMLLVDLLVFVVLRALARRLGSLNGLWIWLIGTTLLGPLIFVRYDSLAALLALLAVLGLASGAPFAAGFALGGGIVAKLWPAVLLAAVPYVRGRWRLLAATFATLALTVVAVLAVGGGAHGGAVFEHQADRGLQVESIPATPIVVMERGGADVGISLFRSSGSWDVTGTGTGVALRVSDVATLAAAAFVLVLAWRVRRRPEAWLDLVPTAMLLAVVTGKVLSPQYLIWLLALLAAALSRRESVLTLPACLVAASALLSQVVYPVYYRDLVNGGGMLVVLVLAIRNAELVAATCVAVSRLWRLTRRPAAPAAG